MKALIFSIAFFVSLVFDSFNFPLVAHKANNAFAVKTIVIDAGHGGHDTGCLGTFEKEKNVTLDIALKLGALIEKNMPDVKVIYTRKTDEFIELYERADIANRNNADLFISIHCNANKNTSAYGTESWVMGLHKSAANLEVAQRENSVILMEDNYSKNYDGFDPNSPESYIMFSLNQSAHLDQSIDLASKVEDEFSNDGRTSRGVKQAGYLVLWRTTMTALLIETGFLTNKTEEKLLASEDGQAQIANSIYDAVRDYKISIEGGGENMPKGNYIPVKDTGSNQKENHSNGTNDTADVKVDADTTFVKNNSVVPLTTNHQPPTTTSSNQVIYKIQIAASNKTISKSDPKYSNIKDMVNDKSPNGLNRYVVGNYTKRSDADARMKKMQASGFKDAFVVAYKNGKRVPLSSLQ